MRSLADFVTMIIGVGGSIAVFTLVQRLLMSTTAEEPTSLAQIAAKRKGEMTAFESINPSGGVVDRLDFYLVYKLGLGPKIEELYMLLGRPETPTPMQILHWKEMAAVMVPAFLAVVIESPYALLLMPAAFMLPDMYLKGKIQERQRQIIRSFPALVDLAALTIESGLDYMSAFDRILKSATKKSDLEIEMEKTLSEVGLGYSRREALRRFALRTGLQEVRSFTGLIIQSDELGTSLVDLLRNYSSDLRFRRMNRAEKAAAQASTKMLFPIFFFIFPTVFILMLAPMLVNLFSGGLGF